ncbi:hypothetical protein HZA96_02010 [Candidatus Woesearchaeota archaeon]|nr:hypothetical protein [Candidatus Woesearchaeota archaeon]
MIPTDLPKSIRYDFFMALLGIVLLYFLNITPRLYEDSFKFILLLMIGTSSLVYGLFEMSKNYQKENEINNLERIIKKRSLMNEINQLKEKTKLTR